MEGTSGLIIAFVVTLWAAYFVPLVLRRYDEGTRNAALDVPNPTHTVLSTAQPSQEVKTSTAPITATAAPRLTREASRIAARRRRNTLLTLVALLAIVVGTAAFGVISWWFVAAPVALIVAWLVACRLMVRRELGLARPRVSAATTDEATDTEPAVESADDSAVGTSAKPSIFARLRTRVAGARAAVRAGDPADSEPTVVVSHQFEEHDPDRRHVMEHDVPLEAHALDEQLQIAVPSASIHSGEALWDPLPVTVPTYVTKPRAGRTVRTIDFNEPGNWTSGHVEGEDTELPSRHDDDRGDERHAVGH